MKRLKLILTSIFFTLVAFALYSVFSPSEKELAYVIEMTESVQDAHFKTILGHLMGPPFVEGNSVKTLLNGEQIFPAMLKAISSAQKSITFESYIYWSGNVGGQFVEALIDRAQHGVKVHILLDWAGSEKIKEDYISRMKQAGIEVERYHELAWYNISRLNNRTHRKILVIDGEVGFTGGVGIADEWDGNGLDPKKWRDTHYEIRGPVVAQMQSAFFDNWMKVRPEIHHSVAYFPNPGTVKKENTATAQCCF